VTPVLYVLGRFPPPLDGQAVATERLASLLEGPFAVRRVPTTAPEGSHAVAATRLRPERVRHYLRNRRGVRRALAETPMAPVLWPSVSPSPLGHWRDLLTVAPAFVPRRAVYAVVHRGDFDRLFRSPLTAPTARRLVRRLAGTVFLSPRLSERCAAWIPAERRFVVPNTIGDDVACTDEEVAARRADATRRLAGRSALRLLYLSNMIPTKGFADVLDAVELLRAGGRTVHATFAGRWESEAARATFEGNVAARGLESSVTHLGGVPDRGRVKELYLAADLFLLPTYYPTEAQPLTILEAMNAGTPVLATAHAGIPDVVTDGLEGRLVPPRDPTALADAAESLSRPEAWLRCSTAARSRFESAFSPGVVRRRWMEVLGAAASEV
jgi:glycosyltransferase involved in cell wall biosynthesis